MGRRKRTFQRPKSHEVWIRGKNGRTRPNSRGNLNTNESPTARQPKSPTEFDRLPTQAPPRRTIKPLSQASTQSWERLRSCREARPAPKAANSRTHFTHSMQPRSRPLSRALSQIEKGDQVTVCREYREYDREYIEYDSTRRYYCQCITKTASFTAFTVSWQLQTKSRILTIGSTFLVPPRTLGVESMSRWKKNTWLAERTNRHNWSIIICFLLFSFAGRRI